METKQSVEMCAGDGWMVSCLYYIFVELWMVQTPWDTIYVLTHIQAYTNSHT